MRALQVAGLCLAQGMSLLQFSLTRTQMAALDDRPFLSGNVVL